MTSTIAEARRAARMSLLGPAYDAAVWIWDCCLKAENEAAERLEWALPADSEPSTGLIALRWGCAAIIGHYAWFLTDRIERWATEEHAK